MPLVTVTLRAPKAPAFKHAILDGVHRALVASGVPEADRFQRVLELPADDFRFDPQYPDVASPRTENFARTTWHSSRRIRTAGSYGFTVST